MTLAMFMWILLGSSCLCALGMQKPSLSSQHIEGRARASRDQNSRQEITSSGLTSEEPHKKHTQMLMRREVKSNSPSGKPKCPCVGIAGRTGAIAEYVNKKEPNLAISAPEGYGSSCKDWDNDNYPGCKAGQTPGKDNGWCATKWCWVDPCNCDIGADPVQSGVFPDSHTDGKPLYYSYDTCGGADTYSADNNERSCVAQIEQDPCEALKVKGKSKCTWKHHKCKSKDVLHVCAEKNDEAVWGTQDCPCIGISNRTGFAQAKAGKDTTVAYPAGVGSYCKAWEENVNYPGCDKDDAPDWCSQKWCYVDPCNCKMDDDPVITFVFPNAEYKNKPLFYSYSACGGSDSFTASNHDSACVNQDDQAACHKLKDSKDDRKCAWKNGKCKGKAVVEQCGAGDDDDDVGGEGGDDPMSDPKRDNDVGGEGDDDVGGEGESWW